METITKKCNKCKKALSVEVFGDNGKGECFKTCDTCRSAGRASKEKQRKAKDMKPTGPRYCEETIIYINLDAVVSKSNIEFIIEKTHFHYKDDDDIYGTSLDFEDYTINVYMTERGDSFVVKLGDTWGEVMENIKRYKLKIEKDKKSISAPNNYRIKKRMVRQYVYIRRRTR